MTNPLQRTKIEDSKEIYIDGMDLPDLKAKIEKLIDEGYEYVSVNTYMNYECPSTDIKAVKYRMETDEELARRQARYDEYEKRDRIQYERLKAKFDPG